MRDKRQGDASLLMGLILGLFIGGAVALVLTPESGEENRARIAEKAREAKGTAANKAAEVTDKAKDKANEAKDRVEGAAEGVT